MDDPAESKVQQKCSKQRDIFLLRPLMGEVALISNRALPYSGGKDRCDTAWIECKDTQSPVEFPHLKCNYPIPCSEEWAFVHGALVNLLTFTPYEARRAMPARRRVKYAMSGTKHRTGGLKMAKRRQREGPGNTPRPFVSIPAPPCPPL